MHNGTGRAQNRRKPGRPKEGTDLRDRILDAAEFLFAEHGYNGTKMRVLADQAGVNQALINYYFGSKNELFDEVFQRKGAQVSAARIRSLEQLQAAPRPPAVREIVRAFLQPQWDMKYSGPGGAAFVRLQAQLHSEPDERALRLRREIYDLSTKAYIRAFAGALPHLSAAEVSLRMAFLVGTYLFMLNDLGRLSDLTDGQVAEVEKESMLSNLERFLTAGFQSP